MNLFIIAIDDGDGVFGLLINGVGVMALAACCIIIHIYVELMNYNIGV